MFSLREADDGSVRQSTQPGSVPSEYRKYRIYRNLKPRVWEEPTSNVACTIPGPLDRLLKRKQHRAVPPIHVIRQRLHNVLRHASTFSGISGLMFLCSTEVAAPWGCRVLRAAQG
eukprot:562454-Prymnesium_polylepis.1